MAAAPPFCAPTNGDRDDHASGMEVQAYRVPEPATWAVTAGRTAGGWSTAWLTINGEMVSTTVRE